MKYLVFRLPVLMEDEGRQDFIGVFSTRPDAKCAIDSECLKSNNYFLPSDYIIEEYK